MYSLFAWCLVPLFGLAQALPQPEPLQPRAPTWTSLPNKLPVSNCLPGQTFCYGVDVTWTITTKTAAAPAATVMAVQSVEAGATKTYWPPPIITAYVNQRIRITVVNKLPASEAITLHFHGLLMNEGFGVMDGPELVTQCGVTPDSSKNTYIYDFLASKSGTYWIHSHDPGQYPKGLRTPLIIYDSQDPSKYPGTYSNGADEVITLSDWWKNFWATETTYEDNRDAPNWCASGVEIVPEAVTFNDNIPGVVTPGSRTKSQETGYYVLNTQNGNTHTRFRLINMSAYSQFFVTFDAHPVTVIEVDGVLIKRNGEEEETYGVVIAPGQRISVLLKHKGTADRIHPYRIVAALDPSLSPHFKDDTECDFAEQKTLFTWGCFMYDTIPAAERATKCAGGPDPAWPEYNWLHYYDRSKNGGDVDLARLSTNFRLKVPWSDYFHTPVGYPWNYNERKFEPLNPTANMKKPKLTDVKPENVFWFRIIDFLRDQEKQSDPKVEAQRGFATMNSTLWRKPDYPAFLTALSSSNTNPSDAGSYGDSENSIVVPNKGDTVWLVFYTANGDHPMHLHGHHFSVLYKGYEDPASQWAYADAIASGRAAKTRTPSDPAWQRWLNFRDSIIKHMPDVPLARDTIMAEKNNLLVLAFVADNPGVWALHCHNDYHAKTGMLKQVIEAPAELKKMFGTFATNTGILTPPPDGPDRVSSPILLEGLKRNLAHCYGFDNVA